ncbi:MAG: hypothetical protein ACR2P5_07775 [Gammaproteobacteria bacterium]
MKEKLKKISAAFLLAVFAVLSVSGCGGKTANPISAKEVGDKELDCDEIEAEMSDLDARARRLLGEQSNKTGKNVALGVAGWFLLVPWFFMDLSDAERQEAQAMQDRIRHLQRIANKKDCDI